MRAEKLGNKIGNLVIVDTSKTLSGWAKNVQMRVEINFKKPLIRFVFIARGGGKGVIGKRITFERLHLFCYFCGIIGHTEPDSEYAGDGSDNGSVKQYDSWLRASPEGKAAKTKEEARGRGWQET